MSLPNLAGFAPLYQETGFLSTPGHGIASLPTQPLFASFYSKTGRTLGAGWPLSICLWQAWEFRSREWDKSAIPEVATRDPTQSCLELTYLIPECHKHGLPGSQVPS